MQVSIEIGVRDAKHIAAARRFLPPGKKHFVSFLPGQAWRETLDTCAALAEAGFEPVPHIPVRRLDGPHTAAKMLRDLAREGGVRDLLLIAGDYAQAVGPYRSVADVLHADLLRDAGFARVSFAGHPEGHPHVPLDEIRRAEREKAAIASSQGLETTFVTQFGFEAQPLLDWLAGLRADGYRGRAVAGIAGPARATTLLAYALRCGVGPSIRAIRSRPHSAAMLLADPSPEPIIRALEDSGFAGVHLFSFGGYLKTAEWIRRFAQEPPRAEASYPRSTSSRR